MKTVRLTLILVVSTFAAAKSPTPAQSPWQMQQSGTTAGLRGIYSVDGTIAWASGSGGTVLKTIDGGAHWQRCAVPDAVTDGATLDFRGVQAWDALTAIVMASGPGDKSRLYKTTDGCSRWTLLFTNPNPTGFWDGLQFVPATGRDTGRIGHLFGDPVNGKFQEYCTYDYGETWGADNNRYPEVASAKEGESLFAASNSSMILIRNAPLFVTGGSTSRSRTLELHVKHDPYIFFRFVGGNIPVKHGPSAGAISVAAHLGPDSVADADSTKFIERATHIGDILVTVGGDYLKPNESSGTAAFSTDGGQHWLASTTPPHGFRSAVQWSEALKLWITVGTNGSDVSRDDGKTWQPLDNGNWNALSLPFVVGPNGRIARLNPAAIPPSTP
jgi:photosystem II stability/assembly factor-like uncharacterized protein